MFVPAERVRSRFVVCHSKVSSRSKSELLKVAIALTVLSLVVGVGTTALGAQGNRIASEQERTVLVGDYSDLANAQQMIYAGDPTGTPVDSPANRVDPNTADSPFAGVGSVFCSTGGGSGLLGTGTLIHGYSPDKETVRNYILTAAHVVDYMGGLTSGGKDTGDGVIDFALGDVTFRLNAGGSPSQTFTAKSITIHPDWHGFNNVNGPEGASINDDVALIELELSAPAGIPIANLWQTDSGLLEAITSVGYGLSGDGVNGNYINASLTVKRVGFNQRDVNFPGDEPGDPDEVFGADFDGPDASTNYWDVEETGYTWLDATLGNDLETTLGGGDSGGPSFLSDFETYELILGSDGNPILFSNNTYGASTSVETPLFGSFYGGMLIPAYAEWIDGQIKAVPEPGTLAMLACVAAVWFIWRRRR